VFRFPLCAIVGLLLAVSPTLGQPPAPAPNPPPAPKPIDPLAALEAARVPGVTDTLRGTLDALGASTGVPDGVGLSWYPRTAVRDQPATMTLGNYQFGFTAPVYTGDDQAVFADGSLQALGVRSHAILPTDRVRFPHEFWNVQGGVGYLGQLSGGWSWGAVLNLGTASNRPFNSLAEATLSALAFVRKPSGERDGWLFYIVSTSNGQLGRNIPVPGLAYEYHSDRLTAVIGFPFVTIDYRPVRALQFEMTYAALTDVMTRLNWHITERGRVFTGFEWVNQSWFRANRPDARDQFFMYEKRIDSGLGWRLDQRLDFRLSGGYVFDRFFVENRGLSFSGRNRVDLAPGTFITGQLEFKY
jgi:hypothetical protein